MRKILILLSALTIVISLHGQQGLMYTQYMHNPFILNPAITGTVNYFQIRSIHRFQWVGIEDAPVTNSLSVFGPVSNKYKDMGYGATVYNDVTGPTSNSGIRGAYAYNIAINEEIRISFGAALGLYQYKFDGTQIKGLLEENSDPKLPKTIKSHYLPDGMLGVYCYRNDFQVGFSVDNLFNMEIKNGEDLNSEVSGLNKLRRHYYFLGSYTYIFNRKWSMEGSTVIKGVSPTPLQVDINAIGKYQKVAWFGLSFRTNDAISILGGYIFNKRILLGYSWDINITPIRAYSFGSHELMIGYRFNTLR
jgi:type IX secretion system PorP/SprF family membrane protein